MRIIVMNTKASFRKGLFTNSEKDQRRGNPKMRWMDSILQSCGRKRRQLIETSCSKHYQYKYYFQALTKKLIQHYKLLLTVNYYLNLSIMTWQALGKILIVLKHFPINWYQWIFPTRLKNIFNSSASKLKGINYAKILWAISFFARTLQCVVIVELICFSYKTVRF